jgi:hypothetical protein
MSHPAVAERRSAKTPDKNPRRRSEIFRVIQLDFVSREGVLPVSWVPRPCLSVLWRDRAGILTSGWWPKLFGFADTINTVGAPSFAVFAKGGCHERLKLGHSIPKRNLRPTFIHAHRPGFVQKIETITAPRPLLRRADQASLHWIAMHPSPASLCNQHSAAASASPYATLTLPSANSSNSHRSFYLEVIANIDPSIQSRMHKLFQLEHISHMFQSEH